MILDAAVGLGVLFIVSILIERVLPKYRSSQSFQDYMGWLKHSSKIFLRIAAILFGVRLFFGVN